MAKTRLCLAALGLALLVCLVYFPPVPATASADDPLRWHRVAIPKEGMAGGWALASGSDVPLLSQARDGTLYAYGKGLDQTLLKSTDGGYQWQPVGRVSDALVVLATAPDDAERVYYATTSLVYRSTDGGSTFLQLPANPGGAGSGNIEITSLAVTEAGQRILVVGTRDTDSGQYGGIYSLDESVPVAWTDTGLSGYDVYAVAFSPYFPAQELVGVVTDETDTLVTTRVGNAAWGATIADTRLDRDNSRLPTPVAVATSAAVAFPTNGARELLEPAPLFVAIATGSDEGDVYRIDRTTIANRPRATDLNIGADQGQDNLDVTSLAINGDADRASLMAGASTAQVYFSHDGGLNWQKTTRAPTGQSKTMVMMSPDFSTSSQVYAATSGTESALSATFDGGLTWNQLSLIDTQITTLLDLAPSAGYQDDGTVFLLTWGGKHSLWRRDRQSRWERIFSSALPGIDSLSGVKLAPGYGTNSHTIFVAGASAGSAATWRSKDRGQNFENARFTRDPTTGSSFPIDAWAVASDDTLLIAGFDGTSTQFYRSADGGWSYGRGAVAGAQTLHSIAVSPGYPGDKTILVGNTAGWVYLSRDNGASFQPLPADATSAPLTGSISVAFAPDFERSGTVYAASSSQDEGIYRLVIGRDSDWQSIDGTLPAGGMLGAICLSTEGTLYATNLKAGGGMERSLNPAYALGPLFETVTPGLEDNATLSGLWLTGQHRWSLDTTNKWLVSYRDTLTAPLALTAPADEASGIGTLANYRIANTSLQWTSLEGARSYRWQLDHDTDFSSLPDGFEDTTRATQAKLPQLEPATDYYWRVRVTSPVLSPWSEKWSFTTSLGSSYAAPRLVSPAAGDSQVATRPVFQWDEVTGATSYELTVSPELSFTRPVVVRAGASALPSTAWQSDLELEHGTTYYWKVRAMGQGTASAWSPTRAFATEPAPAPTGPVTSSPSPSPSPEPPPSGLTEAPARETTPPPTTPAPVPPAPPGIPYWARWLMYFGAALLLVAVASLITLIALTRKIGRLNRF